MLQANTTESMDCLRAELNNDGMFLSSLLIFGLGALSTRTYWAEFYHTLPQVLSPGRVCHTITVFTILGSLHLLHVDSAKDFDGPILRVGAGCRVVGTILARNECG